MTKNIMFGVSPDNEPNGESAPGTLFAWHRGVPAKEAQQLGIQAYENALQKFSQLDPDSDNFAQMEEIVRNHPYRPNSNRVSMAQRLDEDDRARRISASNRKVRKGSRNS